ncbi:Uncharacterised protein [Mycobacteroides abscessus subsp. massiliense]|nr:Uncharacterised protein [Mycobacteroides abscessus subsp. massiliense]
MTAVGRDGADPGTDSRCGTGWLQAQALVSARRLAARDPQLLSPVGRSLREDAIALLERHRKRDGRHLRLVTDADTNA